MADIIASTLGELNISVAEKQNTVNEETANGGKANASVAAAKKAATSAQAVTTGLQGAQKDIGAQQAKIDSAAQAWTSAKNALDADAARAAKAKTLRETIAVAFPDDQKITADDLENKAKPAVEAVDEGIQTGPDGANGDLKAAQEVQRQSQADLDAAAQDLSEKIQALLGLSATLTDAKKAADAAAANAQKLTQAGDLESLFGAVVSYADFAAQDDKITAAVSKYDTALADANTAMDAWKAKLAAKAEADLAVIDKQLALDIATAEQTRLQQLRDVNALSAVKGVLISSSKTKTPAQST